MVLNLHIRLLLLRNGTFLNGIFVNIITID